MELKQLARHSRMSHDPVDDAGDRPGDHRARIIHTVSHGVTDSDLDRDLVLVHQLHQLQTEWNDKAIDIGACDIFKVASRTYPYIQAFADDREVMLERLLSCHFQLVKDMIVRTAHQDPGLFQPDLLDKLKILSARPDPARHLGELISLLQAAIHSVAVFFAVKEELALPDLALRSSQTMEIIIDRHDLLCRIWSS